MGLIHDQERKLPALGSKIRSSNLSIRKDVKEASDIWEGTKETSSKAYPVLKSYWDSIGWRESQWSPTGTPWSAAFVSWLLRNQRFPGDAAHTKYIRNVIEEEGQWTAYSIPKNADKLVVSVGDVLIAPRSGGYANSHGDVVYNLRSGAADLIGGNLSNSVGYKSIGLNPNGTISDPKKYIILLKRNPTTPLFYWTKQLLFWGTITGVIGVGGYHLYQQNKGKTIFGITL